MSAPSSNAHWTLDDELARIAREEIPGFAGHYFDENGNHVVLLADARQRARAVSFAARERGRMRLTAAGATILREARWDFASLKDWHDELFPRIAGQGLVLTDIDEVNNRLLIGVEEERFTAGVRAAALALGIPAAALKIEQMRRTEMRGTIREERTAKAAGLQIQNLGPEGPCTLGFNANWQGVAYFITASHCSDNQFGPDIYAQSAMYQPDWAFPRDSIAEEELDPGLTPDRYGNPFRYSDASMYRYRAGVQRAHGRIMRTTYSASGQPGSLDVNEANPYFDITFKNVNSTELPSGTVLQKVGRTTGWTYGTVTNACVNLWADGAQTKLLRCQWITNVYSDPGDSGSPIFYFNPDGSVTLHGLLWGGPVGDPHTTFYSPISGIEADMARTLDVEAVSGPPASPSITAYVVDRSPHLTWNAVAGATQYRIYRRIRETWSISPWEIWNTVSGTSYTDVSTWVTSFYAYDTYPDGRFAAYQVRAVNSQGLESPETTHFATFIPDEGPMPY